MSNPADPSRHFTVAELMTGDVVTVSTSTPVKEAARLMSSARISAIPVIGVDGAVVGIISETDFMGKRVNVEVVGELMTSPVATAAPGDVVPAAARTMLARNVKSLPVIDADGKLVGIVSRADLLKVFLRSDEDIHRDVAASIAAAGADVEPPGVEITVTDGVVTLTGVARSAGDADRVVTAAIAVSGAVHIRHDALTVVTGAPHS